MSEPRHGPRRGRPPHPDVLTPAEWRVLECIREGASNAEIADRLNVSVNTVRYHVSNMLAKLDLDDRTDLAAWDGEPAAASRSVLRRFSLAAPIAWLRESGWGGKAAAAGGVVALSAAGILVIAAVNGSGGAVAPSTVPAEHATPVREPGEVAADTQLHEFAALAENRARDGGINLRLQTVRYFPGGSRYEFDFVNPEQSRMAQITAVAGTPAEEWEMTVSVAVGERLWRGDLPELHLAEVGIDIQETLADFESAHDARTEHVTIWNDHGLTAIRASILLRDMVRVNAMIDPVSGDVTEYGTGAPFRSPP